MLPSNLAPPQLHHRNHLRHRLNRPHPHAACELPALPQTGEEGSAPIGLLGRGAGDVRYDLRSTWRGTWGQAAPLPLSTHA